MLPAAVPYVKCHSLFHPHEKNPSIHQSIPQDVWAAFGRRSSVSSCWRAPFLPPPLCSPPPPGHMGLGVIDSFTSLLCLGVLSTLLSSSERWPQQCAQALKVSPQTCSSPVPPPMCLEDSRYTCVSRVLGLVTYTPSIQVSDNVVAMAFRLF